MQFPGGALVASDVAAATHGRVIAGAGDHRVSGASIDSRTVAPGELFFAIRAARDGHAFAADAAARGAGGVVVDHPVPVPQDYSGVVVQVADTTEALQQLGHAVRRASGARVIAITGSAGKTTTKDAIAAVLARRFRVVKNRGNLNNHLGLPISLIELRHGAEVAVMELGMNHAGEIRVLTALADPDVRVWTNVGDAHIGNFGSREGIADAKAEILEGAGPSTLLVCNGDDPLVKARVRTCAGRLVTFGLGETCDVRATDVVDRGIEGTTATVRTRDGQFALRLPLVGTGNLLNALAAAAIGLQFGIPTDEIAAQLGTLQPADHRGAVIRRGDGVTIVDDSYNASPAALRRALEVLARTAAAGRRVALLGEMLELGESAEALHVAAGRDVAQSGVVRLVTVGGSAARALADSARAAGVAAVDHAASSAEAAALVAPELRAGDVVLVKGSRGTQMDRAVARLQEEVA